MEWLILLTMLAYHGLQGALIWVIKSVQEQEARRPRRSASPGVGWPGGHHPMGATDRTTRDDLDIVDREFHAFAQLVKRRHEKPEKVDWKNEGF